MLKINKNVGSALHNTTKRPGKIEWIAIHYVGALGDAKANVNHYNKLSTTNASADFFVGHTGDIWQYNPDPVKRYCWAVGGKKYANGGGKLYGKATNKNTIHIEMCVKNSTSNMSANSPGWFITEKTLQATIELTKYLMELYNIPAENVIRHFDVNGKPCPGVVGWNALSGSEAAWKSFHSAISKPATQAKPEPGTFQVKILASVLNIRNGPSTDYRVVGKIEDKGVYTITEEKDGWGRLKSKVGWISLNAKYTRRL